MQAGSTYECEDAERFGWCLGSDDAHIVLGNGGSTAECVESCLAQATTTGVPGCCGMGGSVGQTSWCGYNQNYGPDPSGGGSTHFASMCTLVSNVDCVETTADRSTCTSIGQELVSVTTQQAGTGAACAGASVLCAAGDGSIPPPVVVGCTQQVGTTLSCSSSTDCVYTTTVMNAQELSASVTVAAGGSAGFVSAGTAASVSGSQSSSQSSTEQASLAPGTCKFYVLHISEDYSNSGCAASKEVLARTPALDADGRCPIAAEYAGSRPECSAAQTDAFITQCGLLPTPAPPPSTSAAATPWQTASAMRAMACMGAASWLWSGWM